MLKMAFSLEDSNIILCSEMQGAQNSFQIHIYIFLRLIYGVIFKIFNFNAISVVLMFCNHNVEFALLLEL